MEHLVECFRHAPTDEGLLSPLRAWESLQLQKSGYVHDVTDGVKAVYQPGNVSLPQGGAGLVDMMSILPPHLHAQLSDGSQMLRDEIEVEELLKEIGPAQAMGTVLQRRGFLYGKFLGELIDNGILEVAGTVRATAGVFFVKRKDGKARLIFDTRVPNAHFRSPPATRLASGDALSELNMHGLEGCFLDGCDVEVCFYQYLLPAWARAYFCLPAIKKRFLPAGVRSLLGVAALGPADDVIFQVRVCPMGWSWAGAGLLRWCRAARSTSCETSAPSCRG